MVDKIAKMWYNKKLGAILELLLFLTIKIENTFEMHL